MAASSRHRWSVDIAAPPGRVYRLLTGPASYGQWTAAFGEGLRFDGSWQEGARIRFLTTEGHGLVSEVAANRPGELLSIRHLGYIDDDGVEDTDSESIRAWAPAYENYRFAATAEGTRLTVEQDITAEFEGMVEAWPRALASLKALCEGDAES